MNVFNFIPCILFQFLFFLNNEIRIYSPINLQLRLMKNHDI
ncbi:hypothetical protein GLYMA_08G135350v4 [Glycine max]|nr:hypothetical protein GLYMA_08G135350v4 [Glycine max]